MNYFTGRKLTCGFILFVLTLSALAWSSKDANTKDGSPVADGMLQYRVNGELVVIQEKNASRVEGAQLHKQHLPIGGNYEMDTQQGINYLVFDILTDSLTTKVYTFDSAASRIQAPVRLMHNQVNSEVIRKGDFIRISITTYANGLASGKFTAKLTPFYANGGNLDDINAEKGSVMITDGEFKNIKCVY